jgi:hypothetical protein
MVVGERARWEPSRLSMEGDWKSRMWSIHETGDMEAQLVQRRATGRVLVGERWSRVLPSGAVSPSV